MHVKLLVAAAVLLCASAAALAQAKGATQSCDRSTPGSSQLRNFTLKNTAEKTITDTRVRLTDNSTRVLTDKEPITKNHSQTFAAPGNACVTEVEVRFQGGRTLEAKGFTDCNAGMLVVDDGRIIAQGSPTSGPPAPVQISPAN